MENEMTKRMTYDEMVTLLRKKLNDREILDFAVLLDADADREILAGVSREAAEVFPELFVKPTGKRPVSRIAKDDE